MATRKKGRGLPDDAFWHKDAVVYQTHVRAFLDSNGDGIGDFRGLTSKLDYLDDLGITALWLLPFYPSPLRDDGYDIADYADIHPSYGSLRDFQIFLNEAHHRGIRVITEMVINHTSDQHEWFQRARRAPKSSKYRDWYVWSDTPDRYDDARIIFKDFETSNWTWDSVAGAYYWHRFYSHQPDLNFDNPAVQRAVLRMLDMWFEMGVDGLRLDAIPYLFERDGTSCENLPETHQHLKDLRAHVDRKFASRVFLAEANQWPEDASAYFGNGDECHMAFHFPLMPRLFMSLRREDRFPIVDILEQTPQIPDACQWALFLRNHDELTLEMVTDAERDYMYRTYGRDARSRINLGIRRRLAPLLDNNRRRIELMTSLLLSLPGSPIIYYGDEIGMGDNVYLGDRNGVRTPMQWSGDRNAGFSRADPQSLYLPVISGLEYHYGGVNVENQQDNPHSLLWWYKRIIGLRKRHKVFGRGSLEFLHPQNNKILAFLREYEGERVLIVANLSRFVQGVQLELPNCRDWTPIEMFGSTRFPSIREEPYFLTLGPHGFYWFLLEAPRPADVQEADRQPPHLVMEASWRDLFGDEYRETLEAVLPDYLRQRRWFGAKARPMQGVEITECIDLPNDGDETVIVLAQVNYADGDPETYQLSLSYARGEQATILQHGGEAPILARVGRKGEEPEGVIYDAVWNQRFGPSLLEAINRRRRMRGEHGSATGHKGRAMNSLLKTAGEPIEPVLPRAEQSNTSIFFRDANGTNLMMLKLFRRMEPGINPDLEMGRYLADTAGFTNVPPYAGMIEYRNGGTDVMTLGMLQGFVQNQGDAWDYTIHTVERYMEQAVVRAQELEQFTPPVGGLAATLGTEVPAAVAEWIGDSLHSAQLLGQRTAEMHIALATPSDDPDFTTERFLHFHRHALHHEILGKVTRVLRLLQNRLSFVPEEHRESARRLSEMSGVVRKRLQPMRDRRISAKRMRVHGDYHLGQVLFTGRDFVIIDFEGEPALAQSERRIKRTAVVDVAGMLRSFHYASRMALVGPASGSVVRPEDMSVLDKAADIWYGWMALAFLRSYWEFANQDSFLPKSLDEFEVFLEAYLLDKAAYELTYELNNRPDWSPVPIKGLLQLLCRETDKDPECVDRGTRKGKP